MSQSPPPPSQDLAPFLSRFSCRKTLVHSIQKGEAPAVGEEVSDLAPVSPVSSLKPALISASAQTRSLSCPLGRNKSNAARQRPRADSRRSTCSNASIAMVQAAWAAEAEPRASIPCFLSRSTWASQVSAFPQSGPLDATAVPALVERLESYGRDPARAPRRTPSGRFRAEAWRFAGLPLQSLWHRRRSRTQDPSREPTAAATSPPCDPWRCDKRPRSCSSARCRPRLVAPKKDLIESQGLDLVAHFWSSTFRTAPARFASALTQRPMVEWSGVWPGGKRIWNRSSV